MNEAAPFNTTAMQAENAMKEVLAKIAAMPRRSNDEHDRQRFSELMDAAHCPLRHRKRKPESDEAFGECLKVVQGKLTHGYTVILCGTRGTGKTQLAVEAIKDAARRGFTSRYETFYRFCQRLKETFDRRNVTEAEVIAEYLKPRLLVLDEVGKVSSTEWAQSALFNIVDRRYNSMRDTILLTNHAEAELASELGASIVRRASETGGTIDTTPWKKRHLT